LRLNLVAAFILATQQIITSGQIEKKIETVRANPRIVSAPDVMGRRRGVVPFGILRRR
jgi:hypothetical protein